jgi:hypothetical protein
MEISANGGVLSAQITLFVFGTCEYSSEMKKIIKNKHFLRSKTSKHSLYHYYL